MTQRFQYRYLAKSLAQIFLVQACFINDLDGNLQEEEKETEDDEEQEAEGRISQSIDECSFKSLHTQRIFGCGCEFVVVFGFGPEGERTNRVQRRESGERKAKGACTTRHERTREREARRDRLKLCGLSCSVASPRNESK